MRILSIAILAASVCPSESLAAQDAADATRFPYEGTLSIVGTVPQVDVTCILASWRILGALACPTPSGGIRVCLLVENAYPTGIMEVVRQQYRSHYAELSGALKALEPVKFFGKSASVTACPGAGDSLQFTEARVYSFVPDLGFANSGIPLAIPRGSFFEVSYVSELDGWGWRIPAFEALFAQQSIVASLKSCDRLPDLKNCAGCWGSYWPRSGAVEHPSQVTGAHLQALRAGRAASSPMGRVVLSTYRYEPRTGHYLQMLKPWYRTCLPIGSRRITLWEKGAGSSFGAYAFIHFGVFLECEGCLPVTLAPERPAL
jgi:hypothetical protein